MCINFETSVVTLIIGTLVNLLLLFKLFPYIQNGNTINENALFAFMFIIIWQYALLMQIPDAIGWHNIKNNESTTNAGKLAFILNVTQPLISLICVGIIMIKLNLNFIYLIPAIIVFILYVVNIFSELNKNTIKYDINPAGNCSSLNYQWWEKINVIYYLIVFLLIFIAPLNFKWATTNVTIYLISLAISVLLINNCGNFGSMWCWTIASAGLINYFII